MATFTSDAHTHTHTGERESARRAAGPSPRARRAISCGDAEVVSGGSRTKACRCPALHHQRLRHRGARRGGSSRRGEGIAARGVDAEAAGTGTGGLAAVLGRARALGAALADARTRSARAECRSRPSAALRGGRGGGLRVARDHILEFGSGRGGTSVRAAYPAPWASRRPRAPRAPQASSRWRGSQARRTSFPFPSARRPLTDGGVSAARPSPSFAGRFVTPDEAKDARSERAVDFASEARALRGDGGDAGGHAGDRLGNSRRVSLGPGQRSAQAGAADARRAPPACCARFA